MTRAADARSHAVSPAEIVFGILTSRAEKAEREACRVQRRMGATKVAVRSWRPSRRWPDGRHVRRSHALGDADDVPVGIREHRDLHGTALGRLEHGLRAELLG